ncbi:DUF4041 domain-containing protein [Empedobacter brevis]
MGLFDFLKKKEFDEISKLKNKITILNTQMFEQKNKNNTLSEKNEILSNQLKIANEAIMTNDENISRLNILLEKYAPIINIDEFIKEREETLNDLKDSYSKSKILYDTLEKQVKLYSEIVEPIEFGVYEPIFNYNHSDDYKLKIKQNTEQQKQLFKNNLAITSFEDHVFYNFGYEGFHSAYKKSINDYKKIISIAFNSECDSYISKVRWNNLHLYEQRITDLFYRLNRLSSEFCYFLLRQNYEINSKKYKDFNNFIEDYSKHKILISDELLRLKIEELKLKHELQLKIHDEKEEEKRIRELIREEEKAQKDYAIAQIRISQSENRIIKEISTKKYELSKDSQNNLLKLKIEELEKELERLIEEKKRAISMAQLTKAGFVYIISNIGSFGEDVFKIGLTRRLEPRDRIRELSNASVPFQYDVHTLIYSEDAPKLEKDLHKEFEEYKVNLVNNRKEFFKIPMDFLESKIIEFNLNCNFIRKSEAIQYNESLKLKNSKKD